MFSKFFRSKQPEVTETSAPMHVTIDRSVTLDRMAFAFWGKETLMELPSQDHDLNLKIMAQGQVDLGEGQFIYRMYPDEDTLLLQFTGPEATDPSTPYDDIVLWYYHHVAYPNTDAEWNTTRDTLKASTYSYADHTWQRVWFEGDNRPQDPVTYWEKVFSSRTDEAPNHIEETTMLYHRPLPDGEVELLQIIQESPEDGDRCVSYLIGRILNAHQITA